MTLVCWFLGFWLCPVFRVCPRGSGVDHVVWKGLMYYRRVTFSCPAVLRWSTVNLSIPNPIFCVSPELHSDHESRVQDTFSTLVTIWPRLISTLFRVLVELIPNLTDSEGWDVGRGRVSSPDCLFPYEGKDLHF